jgi:energy-coupling factor transport system permease protein
MAVAVLAVMLLSKVPIRMYLRNLKTILPIVIFTAIINLLYTSANETPIFSWWIITITVGGILNAVFMALRILLLILISAVLTYTTTPTELTDGIESLLKPLKLIGLGGFVHNFAMMMTIALRFIPTLTDETDKIISAQKSRGADFEEGGFLKKIKALLPILIPLLFSAIRRADELADAMDSRCYSGDNGRTRMKQLKAGGVDYTSILILTFCFVGVIVLGIYF